MSDSELGATVTFSLIDFQITTNSQSHYVYFGEFNLLLMNNFIAQMRSPRAKYKTKSINNYEDLELKSVDLLRGIYDYGFKTITELQKKCIMPIISSEPPLDVAIKALSGTDKEAAFAIALLNRIDSVDCNYSKACPQALVLLPTRELVVGISNLIKQIGTHLRVNIFNATGGISIKEMLDKLSSDTFHVVVGTPGRTFDLISRRRLSLKNLKILILDEVEYMVEMGFEEQVLEILNFSRSVDNQICLFSESLNSTLIQKLMSQLRDPLLIN